MFIVDNVINYLQCIQEMPVATMFRGQLDTDFELVPSIARYAKVLNGYESIEGIEEDLISEFEKYVCPMQDLRNLPLIETLVHAQHYGLPTRLLDWSTNPLKALYFAVENPAFDGRDAVVIVFSPLFWFEGTKEVTDISQITAFYPEILNERINAQDGCFTAFPLPSSGFSVPELSEENYPNEVEFMAELLVPKEAKIYLRAELNQLGINHRTIYPGIDGVARWIKSSFSGYRI